jgi:Nucleotide-sugar transporter
MSTSTQHGVAAPGSGQPSPLAMRVLALLGLAAVQVFAGVVLKLAQSNGVYAFSPQSSLVMSEAVKMGMSASYLLRDKGGVGGARRAFKEETTPLLVAHMTGLAGVYAFNNALAFWLFARADPGAIMLTKASSSVVSAVMLYFVRGFVISGSRWLLLLIQVLGLVTAQYDSRTGAGTYSSAVYSVMLLTIINSNVANVWNERVIQNFETASMATKNVYLYGLGAALNMIGFIFARATSPASPAFFQGYGPAAMAVVTSNALIGVSMNFVYKYADALVKTIATSITSITMLILSAAFFHGRADALVFVGGLILVSATYLYFEVGNLESKVPKRDPSWSGKLDSNSDKDKTESKSSSLEIPLLGKNKSDA